MTERVQSALRERFRPELLNRMDEILLFHPLGIPELKCIAAMQLEGLGQRLRLQEIGFEPEEGVADWLASHALDREYGARPLRRLICRTLTDPASDLILAGKLTAGKVLSVKLQDGIPQLSVISPKSDESPCLAPADAV